MLDDLKKRIFIVKMYHKTESLKAVERAYQAKYGRHSAPGINTIKNIISTFEKHGSVIGTTTNRKPTSEKREEVKNQLKTMIAENPTLSTRKAASALQCSQTLIVTVLHDDLHLKPFKFHNWHVIEEQDYEKRLVFAEWFLSLRKSTEQFMIFSDEAHFYLTLPNNKQNNRYWGDSAQEYGIEVPLHDKKLLVWCAISANRVFGPYIFDGTVNSTNYFKMLKSFFWPKVLRTPDYQKYYFQQDGASPDKAAPVQTWLTEKFGRKFIAKNELPPRSPDLNPCDYFCGAISSRECTIRCQKH
jgi:transposase